MGESQNSRLQSWFVTFLVVVFGTGSWITISGLWTEVPVLIEAGIPEEYQINSYMVVVINMANVGPILFILINSLLSVSRKQMRPEIPANYVITFIAMVGTFLQIFCWNKYTVWSIDNKLHSTAFFLLLFCISLVDITSNVTFVAFMSLMKPELLNWFWIGQGSGALLPALASLIQSCENTHHCIANYTYQNTSEIGNGTEVVNCTSYTDPGPELLFGPSGFFGFLFTIMVLCHVSYIGLNYLPCAKREYVSTSNKDGATLSSGGPSADSLVSTKTDSEHLLQMPADGTTEYGTSQYGAQTSTRQIQSHCESKNEASDVRNLSISQYIFLYVIYFWDYFLMYGVFSSIQSFSAAAYGRNLFRILVPIREIVKVVGFLFFLLKPVYSFPLVLVTFIMGSIGGFYCLHIAIMSPNPPMQGQLIGQILLVCAWICEGTFLIYCKAAIVWIIRHGPNNRKHLIWSGFVSQIGVMAGGLIMFIFISVLKVFEPYHEPSCPDECTCLYNDTESFP